MKIVTAFLAVSFLLLLHTVCLAQKKGGMAAIYSGVPWFDNEGRAVSAHGACIVKDGSRYYLFGERHTDTSNAFAGFNCYSSADLYNWKFESIALSVQGSGKLGPNRVGERPKVMKCPATGEYIMYMHADTLGYVDQFVGYATSPSITGPYTFRGPLLFNGKPIKKWDMGTFQDRDDAGYVLLHGGDIYRLADDYKSIVAQVNKAMAKGFEAPTLFRKDSTYYFIGSDLTGWERNDNYYYTATSLAGPWTLRGNVAPKGTLTWNSQTTFVLPIQGSKGTTYMYMGDRWSFPRQASAATYVWQPLVVKDTLLSIPKYMEAWTINTATGMASEVAVGKTFLENTDSRVQYSGNWKRPVPDSVTQSISDVKGAFFTVPFTGRQVGLYGVARPDGGYAQVTVRNSKGKVLASSVIDLYCSYPVSTLKFVSPVLPPGKYTVMVSVLGEHWYWKDKKQRVTGSAGNVVSLEKVVVMEK